MGNKIRNYILGGVAAIGIGLFSLGVVNYPVNNEVKDDYSQSNGAYWAVSKKENHSRSYILLGISMIGESIFIATKKRKEKSLESNLKNGN